MSKINLVSPDIIINGKQISFVAPCGSENVTSLIINDIEYSIVDSIGNPIVGISGIWVTDAIVSVILDTTNNKAYVQNPAKAIPLEEYVSTILLASNWNSETGTYSFESSYPSDKYNIEIQPAESCTVDQFTAWSNAGIVGNSSSNIIKALGDIPAVDIPIIVKVVMK